MPRRCFDKSFYDHYYRNPRTRVATRSGAENLGRFVCCYLKHIGQPVTRVLDVGCGLGLWKDVIRRHFRQADYTGVEVSPYLCRQSGWEEGSVVDYKANDPFDFAICQSVLQYLTAADARRAIRNLARLCEGALFLEVLTQEDWQNNADQSVTDGDVYLREADWYRRELDGHFTNCGGGIFLSPRSPAVLYELETP
ncbi:MAG: methyltransferase type 11 [Planctomycetaceae bacterium]|nr:methyltransferase type 11 [Planctomycetaceae bacterium]